MGWLLEEFARAEARSAQVPDWAKPVRINREKEVMAKNKVTIIYLSGAVEVVERCSSIRVNDGILQFKVSDTEYTSHHEGHPIEHIQSYRVDGY